MNQLGDIPLRPKLSFPLSASSRKLLFPTPDKHPQSVPFAQRRLRTRSGGSQA